MSPKTGTGSQRRKINKKGVTLRHFGGREKLLVTNIKQDSVANTSTYDIALESSLPVRLLVPLRDGFSQFSKALK